MINKQTKKGRGKPNYPTVAIVNRDMISIPTLRKCAPNFRPKFIVVIYKFKIHCVNYWQRKFELRTSFKICTWFLRKWVRGENSLPFVCLVNPKLWKTFTSYEKWNRPSKLRFNIYFHYISFQLANCIIRLGVGWQFWA